MMNKTVFIVGNGESRLMYPIEELKQSGPVYGCNAIYRDHPDLCDKIFAVNPPMHREVMEAKEQGKLQSEIIGPEDISDWNYVLPGDEKQDLPKGLKLYRMWSGGDAFKGIVKHRDFSTHRGSGCSAVLHAAEEGYKNICILGFDILGARQWTWNGNQQSREQNNVYKNTVNYPQRMNMKAYMKYEWLYHLTQTFRKFPNTNFFFFNRDEYITMNPMLARYWGIAPNNIRAGIYADLKRFTEGDFDGIKWFTFSGQSLNRLKASNR